MEIPKAAQSRSALTFTVDSNVLIDRESDPGARDLFELHESGKVNVEKTNTLDTERTEDQPEGIAEKRLSESRDLVEVLGPMRLDHSRLDHSVLGSPSDQVLDDDVFELIWGRRRTSGTRKQDVRDAFHIATSIRYGLDGFVTRDEALLAAHGRVNAKYPTFHIVSPKSATAVVRSRVAMFERLDAKRREFDLYPT